MPDGPSINRQIALPPALDYRLLRAEGLAHIQRLSGEVWTDHNLHDPGITTLEILCYALTDLAYRTAFDTKDLMTGPDGKMDPPSLSGLAPAHESLTTAPRTIADYRRLLLRIEGLRNAWLDPMNDPAEPGNYRLSEVPIYGDCIADALSFEPLNAAGEANHPVRVSGLYKVQVELEIEAREVSRLQLLDLLDLELGKHHAAFGMVGMGQRIEALGKQIPVADFHRGHAGELVPGHSRSELGAHTFLDRLSPRHRHAARGSIGKVVPLGQKVRLALLDIGLRCLHPRQGRGERLLDIDWRIARHTARRRRRRGRWRLLSVCNGEGRQCSTGGQQSPISGPGQVHGASPRLQENTQAITTIIANPPRSSLSAMIFLSKATRLNGRSGSP